MEYGHDYILGGAKDLSLLPFDVMSGPPESFTGCVRGLHVNNVVLPLEQQNIQGFLLSVLLLSYSKLFLKNLPHSSCAGAVE